MKTDLKVWNHELFDHVSFRKEMALRKVNFWDAKKRGNMLNAEKAKASRGRQGGVPSMGLIGRGLVEVEI